MAAEESPVRDPDTRFAQIWSAMCRGDERAWKAAVEHVAVTVAQAIRVKFGADPKVHQSDVIQSAWRTIHRRISDSPDAFEIQDWGQLSGLVIRFAWNKGRNQLQKKWPQQFPILQHDSGAVVFDAVSADIRPEDEAMLAEAFPQEMGDQIDHSIERLGNVKLDSIDQMILVGKLNGHTSEEIVDSLRSIGKRRSQRTVQLHWQRILEALTASL